MDQEFAESNSITKVETWAFIFLSSTPANNCLEIKQEKCVTGTETEMLLFML